MEVLMASAIAVLIAAAVYLILRARTFDVVLGMLLLAHAVNLFILSMGRLTVGLEPILQPNGGAYPDPLPQALVLTAIVINFGMSAFLVVLALRAHLELGTDHVDGRPDEAGGDAGDGGGIERR